MQNRERNLNKSVDTIQHPKDFLDKIIHTSSTYAKKIVSDCPHFFCDNQIQKMVASGNSFFVQPKNVLPMCPNNVTLAITNGPSYPLLK